ncbi:hypothetical protein AVEN_178248-1, partial [Araneus ventricosus]
SPPKLQWCSARVQYAYMLPGPSKPLADEQMEEVRAVLENDSSTTTSLIEDFPKTTAS